MWSLARRFSPHPLWADAAVPGRRRLSWSTATRSKPTCRSWRSGWPGIASFVERRLAALCFGSPPPDHRLSSVDAIPILAVYVWLYRRDDRLSWLILLTPAFAIAAWQLFELSSGALPATCSPATSTPTASNPGQKLENAAALSGHLALMLRPSASSRCARAVNPSSAPGSPSSSPPRWCSSSPVPPATCCPSPRPSRCWSPCTGARAPLLWTGFALQLALGLGLAVVNYQHWDGYRSFAPRFSNSTSRNASGSTPNGACVTMPKAKARSPSFAARIFGPAIGSSPPNSPKRSLIPPAAPKPCSRRSATSPPSLPLRLIGTGTGSAYSSTAYGLWPVRLVARAARYRPLLPPASSASPNSPGSP